LHIYNSNITTDVLHNELLEAKQVSLSVLRLDKIHPVISGNKLFKLHYFLNPATSEKIKQVVTFGGAYSNHLAATAYACNIQNIPCTGIVRGEKPQQLSHTLLDCISYGMQLQFISRHDYEDNENESFIETIKKEMGDCIIIPEGGYHSLGAKGASLIMNWIKNTNTHICCAAGTATTMAGLLLNKKEHQQVIGVPVLKGMTDMEERIEYLTGRKFSNKDLHIEYGYHFGGYAKKNSELISFMNNIYSQFQLPTDFVYTAKMLYAVFDLVNSNFFTKGSEIVCIHTGGLQGNLSLPKIALTF
jgi:1-aminocyclopropane-1-carboxylate deaminase